MTSNAQNSNRGTGPGGPVPALVDTVDRAITWSAVWIVVGTLTFLFFAIFVNVTLRYLFRYGLTWAYELPAILFPWMVIAGAVLASQKSQHIAVQIVVTKLGTPMRKVVLVAGNLLIAILCALVTKAGLPMMHAAADSHLAVTGISEAWGYSSLVYGYGMMTVTALTTSYRIFFAKGQIELTVGLGAES